MVYLYRGAFYLIMIGAALLLYLLLRRLFRKRTRIIPMVAALLTAAGLLCCAHIVLTTPTLLVKYAPFIWINKQRPRMSMFLMQSEARICNPDGSGDELFMPQDFITTRDITWSPDGTRILCTRLRMDERGMQLFIYDANGENQVQVTTGNGICRRPSWSPDGTRIAFDYRPNLRRKATDLIVIDADGSDRQLLTAADQIHAYHPVWSPDGGSIYCCVKLGHRRGDIWVMDADGGNLRQLTFTPDQAETEPAISPDGSTIALSINRRKIYLMDPDGDRLRPLKTEQGLVCNGRDPSWSPDNRRILYSGFGTSKSRQFLKEIGVDGSGLRQIPLPDGKLLTPMLSPDGTRLAYLRYIRTVTKDVTLPRGRAGKARAQDRDQE